MVGINNMPLVGLFMDDISESLSIVDVVYLLFLLISPSAGCYTLLNKFLELIS